MKQNFTVRKGALDGVEASLSVARHRSFRKAAAELGVTPSAISQAVRTLEARVGVALFIRTTRSVGLTEAKAIEAGYKVKVGKFPFMAVGKAKIEEATDGFIKVVADENLREILGVHMIGHTVTEMITEAVAAMALESTVDDVVNMIHPHPTLSEGMHEAMEAVFGAAIHI